MSAVSSFEPRVFRHTFRFNIIVSTFALPSGELERSEVCAATGNDFELFSEIFKARGLIKDVQRK